MKTILKTFQLEFDKSDFLIDLVEYDNGQLYVEIAQTFFNSTQKAESIMINPSILTDLIKVLQNYHAIIPKDSKPEHKHLTDIDQIKIQKWYLKGVPIKDLAMQFDHTSDLIEMVLRNKEIEIMDNKLPKPKFWNKKYKWKKENDKE